MIEKEIIIQVLSEQFPDFRKCYLKCQSVCAGLIRKLEGYSDQVALRKDISSRLFPASTKRKEVKFNLMIIKTAIEYAEKELSSIPNNHYLTSDEKKEYLTTLAKQYHTVLNYRQKKDSYSINIIPEKFEELSRAHIIKVIDAIKQKITQQDHEIKRYIEEAVIEAAEQLKAREPFSELIANKAYSTYEFIAILIDELCKQEVDIFNYQESINNAIRKMISSEEKEILLLIKEQERWAEKHILCVEQLTFEERKQLIAKLVFFAKKTQYLTKIHSKEQDQSMPFTKEQLVKVQREQLLVIEEEKEKIIISACTEIATSLLGEPTELEKAIVNKNILVQIREQLIKVLNLSNCQLDVLEKFIKQGNKKIIEICQKFELAKQLETARARTNTELKSLGYSEDYSEIDKKNKQIDEILATLKRLCSMAERASSGATEQDQQKEKELNEQLLRQVAEYTLLISVLPKKVEPATKLPFQQMRAWFKTKVQSVKLPDLPVPVKNGIEELRKKAEQLGQVASKPIKSLIGLGVALISCLWLFVKPIVFLYDTFFKDNKFELSLKNLVKLVGGVVSLNIAGLIMFKLVTTASLFSLLMVIFPPVAWLFVLYGTVCLTALIAKIGKSIIISINDHLLSAKNKITTGLSNIKKNIIMSLRKIPYNLSKFKEGLYIKLLRLSNKIYSPTKKLRELCKKHFPTLELDELFMELKNKTKSVKNKEKSSILLRLLFNIRNSTDKDALLSSLAEMDLWSSNEFLEQGEVYVKCLLSNRVNEQLAQKLNEVISLATNPIGSRVKSMVVADLLDGNNHDRDSQEEIKSKKMEYLNALAGMLCLTKKVLAAAAEEELGIKEAEQPQRQPLISKEQAAAQPLPALVGMLELQPQEEVKPKPQRSLFFSDSETTVVSEEKQQSFGAKIKSKGQELRDKISSRLNPGLQCRRRLQFSS